MSCSDEVRRSLELIATWVVHTERVLTGTLERVDGIASLYHDEAMDRRERAYLRENRNDVVLSLWDELSQKRCL